MKSVAMLFGLGKGPSKGAKDILRSEEWKSTKKSSMEDEDGEEIVSKLRKDEEEEGDHPIDLFIEAVGGTPSKEARKAFKLAVKSCELDAYGDEEEDDEQELENHAYPGYAGHSTSKGPYRGTAA
jgi:hypothetical protein